MLTIDTKNKIEFSNKQLEEYKRDGIVYLKSFYDLENEILPIKEDIYKIISILIEQFDLGIMQEPFSPETFDSGLMEIINNNRKVVGILYDAVKKMPSYVRLSSSSKHDELAKALLCTNFFGFANRGYGMRMDNPNEDVYLTQWHQDYVSQLCSPKGIVLWSPLRDVTSEVGPVQLCPGSHKGGIFPIIRDGDGSYGLKLKNESDLLKKYEIIIPEVKVGDMVVIDYLTLHASTPNRSKHTRWAMISRYFDFLEETGRSYGWRGGLQEGNSFETVHPELFESIISPKQ
jgi:Phytanoyl-CoA dioxygenase (PhyH)